MKHFKVAKILKFQFKVIQKLDIRLNKFRRPLSERCVRYVKQS